MILLHFPTVTAPVASRDFAFFPELRHGDLGVTLV
jgi:hypothetical protein